MKKLINHLNPIILACMLYGILLAACNKQNTEDAKLTLSLTDAPAEYVQVNVEIIGFEVNHEDKGWIGLPVKQGIYNLLVLQNNVSVVLADHVEIPYGRISEIRLLLGENNSLQDQNGIYPLKVPSGSQSGLKIKLDEIVTSNQNIDILLDFDANASIIETGSGKYMLKPVLKVKSVHKY